MGIKTKLREMTKEDIPQALEALGKAFVTNPNTIATIGSKPASERGMEIAFAGIFKYLPGQVFIAELDGKIVGAMRIVEWPGCQMSLFQSLKMLPSMLGAIWGLGQLMRGIKLLNAWKKHDPKKPHWHLDPLGVTPELQGKGIGSQMMEFYCKIIDRKGMAAYHETDRPENVPFYERFGFKVVAEETINGVKNWYMWRSPIYVTKAEK